MTQILKEQNKENNIWQAKFCKGFKGFDFVHQLLGQYWTRFSGLPSIDQLNQLAQDNYHVSHTAKTYQVYFEPQQYDLPYEENVFKHRKVYTRLDSWHDFFNDITWILWPKTKWAIVNAILSQSLEQKKTKNRTPKQSFLAQFDECGMLIVTTKSSLVYDVQQHNWTDLFFHKRAQHSWFESIVFGHGLMEKALEPYIGMTGKAMMIVVNPQYFYLSSALRLKFLDHIVSELISASYCPQSAKALQPFPMLGMPGWYQQNERKEFFEQKNYFRAKRSDVPECVVLNQLADKNLWGQWKWLAPHG